MLFLFFNAWNPRSSREVQWLSYNSSNRKIVFVTIIEICIFSSNCAARQNDIIVLGKLCLLSLSVCQLQGLKSQRGMKGDSGQKGDQVSSLNIYKNSGQVNNTYWMPETLFSDLKKKQKKNWGSKCWKK